MKRSYQEPNVTVVSILAELSFLAGSVKGVESNVGLQYRGGGSGEAHSRDDSDWDDD